jgi:hypothetical protein
LACARREIRRYAPHATIVSDRAAEELIANCDVLITQWSSTAYVGLALGKEVYSSFDVEELRRMTPVQNRSAARNIAGVCRELLEGPRKSVSSVDRREAARGRWAG